MSTDDQIDLLLYDPQTYCKDSYANTIPFLNIRGKRLQRTNVGPSWFPKQIQNLGLKISSLPILVNGVCKKEGWGGGAWSGSQPINPGSIFLAQFQTFAVLAVQQSQPAMKAKTEGLAKERRQLGCSFSFVKERNH